MTELWLFIIVGAIAVASAGAMLLSRNAVYSALYLIVTMGCIAFLFLLLEAPFLAMVQITVYAGAIMVLFIFVIMLLGAEQIGAAKSKFGWLTPLAVILATSFLLAAGISVASGGVDSQRPPAGPPLVRVINAKTDAGPVDVYIGEELVASGLRFREATGFVEVEAGEAEIVVNPTEGGQAVATYTLEPGSSQTIVAYGTSEDIQFGYVPRDLTVPLSDTARITFFNAFPEAQTVRLVDLGIDGEYDSPVGAEPPDRVIIEDFPVGAVSESMVFDEGVVDWAFVDPSTEQVLYYLRNFEIGSERSELIVLSGESSTVQDIVRPVAEPAFFDELPPAFGSPAFIGISLFTTYLLSFELVALLLLAAMIGAIVLTHKETERVREPARRRRVSRPLTSVIASQVGRDVTQPPPPDTPALPGESAQSAGD